MLRYQLGTQPTDDDSQHAQNTIGMFWTVGSLIFFHFLLILNPRSYEPDQNIEQFDLPFEKLPEYTFEKLPKWFKFFLPAQIAIGDSTSDSEYGTYFRQAVMKSPLVWACVILNSCILVTAGLFTVVLVIGIGWNAAEVRI